MFDFEFFQDEVLINNYNDLEYENDIYITDDISYNHKDKKLTRITNDYHIDIDFNNNLLNIKLLNENYEGKVSLIKNEIKEKDDKIEIIYQIEEKEPINKIIITRRNNER